MNNNPTLSLKEKRYPGLSDFSESLWIIYKFFVIELEIFKFYAYYLPFVNYETKCALKEFY